jgi:hypothetical protein
MDREALVSVFLVRMLGVVLWRACFVVEVVSF